MIPKDKTGWPIFVGAIVRIHPPDKLKAYTGSVIDIGPNMVKVKYTKRDYIRYTKPEYCVVQRQRTRR